MTTTRCCASVRTGDLPRRFTTDAGERIVFQVWDGASEDVSTVRHFIMDSGAHDRAVSERRTTYRALSRDVLSDALAAAGFRNVTWRTPEQTGYYQPVVSAHTAS